MTILLLLLFAGNSLADTLTVKKDGTGDYLKIQRSEEHTSELQSHSFISYAVFCLKKKKQKQNKQKTTKKKKKKI